MIRRFIPKGTEISNIPVAEVKSIEEWLNDYPRQILGGVSANHKEEELTKNNPNFAA